MEDKLIGELSSNFESSVLGGTNRMRDKQNVRLALSYVPKCPRREGSDPGLCNKTGRWMV